MAHVVCYIAALMISVIFHEQWHARVADWLGDPTGKSQGRLSWNPLVHIDPFLSIVLPAITYLTMGFPFGGARPVPINAMNFKNPGLGLCLSAAAGPLSNLFLAVVGFFALLLLRTAAPSFVYDEQERSITFNALFLGIFVFFNVLLGAFNLLPLPGLDGSRILWYFLPAAGRRVLDAMEPFALIITFLLLRVGAGRVLTPVFALLIQVSQWAFDREFLSALVRGILR